MKSVNKHTETATKRSRSRETSELDIVELILEDHKALKPLLKILKDSELEIEVRERAYEEFAVLLVSHAKPEEDSLYVSMKQIADLRSEGFEGEVEHTLADQMVEEIKRENDQDVWSAKVKVLAELVEHHILEEEKDLLPDFKKNSELQQRLELGQKFLTLKTQMLEQGGEDAPSESEIQEDADTVRH